MTRTWLVMVKGLKGDKLDTIDSVEESDSEEPNPMKARWMRR